MLSLVGLGLCDGNDITLRGKRAIDNAKHVYLEGYTSLLQCTHKELEEQLGKEIKVLDRQAVERNIEQVLEAAKKDSIVLLVIGDPFAATTHSDLVLRAKDMDVEMEVIHNASILTAIGEVGLELYRFGKTVSIPYWEQGYEPRSFMQGIKENLDRGLHTLCLLDIKADEGRFMSIREAIDLIRKAQDNPIITEESLLIGVARLGCKDFVAKAAKMQQLEKTDFQGPPHSLIIAGRLSAIEEEMVATLK